MVSVAASAERGVEGGPSLSRDSARSIMLEGCNCPLTSSENVMASVVAAAGAEAVADGSDSMRLVKGVLQQLMGFKGASPADWAQAVQAMGRVESRVARRAADMCCRMPVEYDRAASAPVGAGGAAEANVLDMDGEPIKGWHSLASTVPLSKTTGIPRCNSRSIEVADGAAMGVAADAGRPNQGMPLAVPSELQGALQSGAASDVDRAHTTTA